MTRLLLGVAGTLLAVYAVACLAAFALQRRLVYFPGRPGGPTPAQRGMAFEDVTLTTSDGVRVHGWLVGAPRPRGVVLVCHGNAGTIADRLPLAEAFMAMGWSCFLLDYRGYGQSEGQPSEDGTYRDAEAGHEHLTRAAGFDPAQVVVYGESLGGGVAIELARRRPVAACVVESTFTSLPDIGARAYPWLPVRLLSRLRYDNRAKIGRLAVPVLVIHSQQDEVVPFAHGQALFEAAREPRQLLVTTGGHNDGGFLRSEQHRGAVQQFLGSVLPEAQEAQDASDTPDAAR